MVLIGASRRTFTNKETNEKVIYYKVFAGDTPGRNDLALRIDEFTLGERKFNEFNVASFIQNKTKVRIYYDKYGKVQEISAD